MRLAVSDGGDVPVEVVRTRRRKKTMSIEVEDGAVRLRVPVRTAKRTLARLLAENQDWIEEKLREKAEEEPDEPRCYVSGEMFAYLGRSLELRVGEGEAGATRAGAWLMAWAPGHLPIEVQETVIQEQVLAWYRARAHEVLAEATVRYAAELGDDVSASLGKIAIKDFKSQWGRCTARGDIAFCWRIIMAPREVAEYLAAHEVAHLIHRNHSRAFWGCVEGLMPDYKGAKAWLKANGRDLWLD